MALQTVPVSMTTCISQVLNGSIVGLQRIRHSRAQRDVHVVPKCKEQLFRNALLERILPVFTSATSIQDVLGSVPNVSDVSKTRHMSFQYGLFNLSFRRNGTLLIQKRGFRSRPGPSATAGGAKSGSSENSSFSAVLGRIMPQKQASKNEEALLGLRKIANDQTLAPETKSKMIQSFTEGFLVNPQTEDKSGQWSVTKSVRTLMLLGMIASLIYVAFQLIGGSVTMRIGGGPNEVAPEDIQTTFSDVRGVEEAKDEVTEVVDYLRDPAKYSRLGGRLPRGVLLVGPPGTGKTLLARAIAGEANVPFFHASGSEFDEMLVGQGARRVRDLFAAAKAKAPAVIFVDEIDSVGQKRSSSTLHPYANQTINQLLAEMDGFSQNEGVIVIGATNRKEDLDKALLRPGRFDVQVYVSPPDLQGRKEILKLYMDKVKRNFDVDIEVLAKGTTGFTGADIENLVNQAALRAAADGMADITMQYLENSRDKVLMGPEKKQRIPDDAANRITAYHEAGHTLVAFYTKYAHPLHKVTIIPRGESLGHTAYIPEKEQYHVSKAQMYAMLDTLMGGRAAEELIFGTEEVTSGASDDLRKATQIVTQMVKSYGMSDKVGMRTFNEQHDALVVVNDISPVMSEKIDAEIGRILNESYERAKSILKSHNSAHKRLAEALLEIETLDSKTITAIIEGKWKNPSESF